MPYAYQIVKNLAAVADAPLTTHSLAFISQLLAAGSNSATPYVVAHRWTGSTWSTTVYDAAAHRLYRATHGKSVRSWLRAIAAERKNIQVLKNDEIMHLQIVEDERATAVAWAA